MAIQKRRDGSVKMTGSDANDFVKLLRGDYKVEEFNVNYSPGDKVVVLDDDGTEFIDEIKHPASIMGGHTAVAWLSKKGSYLLERVVRKDASHA